jgi:hypothetical protein
MGESESRAPGFSVSKLAEYDAEAVAKFRQGFQDRATKLSALSSWYLDQIPPRDFGCGESVDELKAQMAVHNHWMSLHHSAKELADEAQKKANSCQVEIDLRG